MRPGLRMAAGLPILDLLPGGTGNVEAIAYVTGAVVIVVAVLLFILVMAGKTPILRWGDFRFEMTKNDTDESS